MSTGMSRHSEWLLDRKVYVGNLGNNTAKHEIEEAFRKFGQMKNVWVARNPPGFAFVEYDDPRDAEDAVRAMDGSRINGVRVRCEMSHGKSRNSRRGGGGGGGGGGGMRSHSPPSPILEPNLTVAQHGSVTKSYKRYSKYNEPRYRSRSRSPPIRRRYSRSRSRTPKSRSRSPRMPRSFSRSPIRY